MLFPREPLTSAGSCSIPTPIARNRGGTATSRQSSTIRETNAFADSASLEWLLSKSRSSAASSVSRTDKLTRNAAGNITAQASPCGTRQCDPSAAATPCARPSPEFARANPDNKAACDIASRFSRDVPSLTTAGNAGIASFNPDSASA